ncbi:hypothetical protein BgiBS90_007163, partial [Biomphalaria glabrata]
MTDPKVKRCSTGQYINPSSSSSTSSAKYQNSTCRLLQTEGDQFTGLKFPLTVLAYLYQ